MHCEVEGYDRVAVGHGAYGVDGAQRIGVIPLAVDPLHRVAHHVAVDGPVGRVDDQGEVYHRVAGGGIGQYDVGQGGAGGVVDVVLPTQRVTSVQSVDAEGGVAHGNGHYYQRINAIQTAEVHRVGHHLQVAGACTHTVAECDIVPRER